MKVYLTPPQPSRGLQRIADALTRYAPSSVEVVGNADDADLVVIYAIGRRNAIEQQVVKLDQEGKKYALIQICLRSTMAPDSYDWFGIWTNAEVIWSYYDLNRAIADDGWSHCWENGTLANFYHAPLGADAQVFYPRKGELGGPFIIATSGVSRLSESVRECWLAAEAVNQDVLHIGKQFDKHNVVCAVDISDDQLAEEYSACQFVSGLRRTEGFELPAVEGLLCGARPIVFDTPDYHWNYGDHAEYIREGTRAEVVEQLVELFKRGARGVTEEERADAVERFNWRTIVGGFYDRIS